MRRVFVGFGCNNGCVFCAQAEERADAGSATRSSVESELAQVQPGDVVALVGGEPTTYAELPRWIAKAREGGARRVLVQTNGRRLAYQKYVDELVEAGQGVLALDVSLHGATKAMHEHHTRVPESFAQTVLGLRHARARRIDCAVTVVVTRANYRHLVEIVRVVRAVDVRAVRFVAAEARGAARDHLVPLAPPEAMLAPRLATARDAAARLGVTVIAADTSADVDDERFAGPSVTLSST